jgi:invasion protein IalB
MANSKLHFAAGGKCVRRVGVTAAAAALVVTAWSAMVAAQQPAPPAAPKKAPAPPAAQKGAPAKDAKGGLPSGAWVKLCDKVSGVSKTKDGKEEKKDLNVCLTNHERIDGRTGLTLISAALQQVEGQDKQIFMVMVPPGVFLPPGMRVGFIPKDVWEKLQKQENPDPADESKIKNIKLQYINCHQMGCTAEIEATKEVVADLKSASGLTIQFFHISGQQAGTVVPLTGFEVANSGPPVDNKEYTNARKALMEQLAQRQQQLAEEYRRQQEEQQKGAGGTQPQPATKTPSAPPPAQKK